MSKNRNRYNVSVATDQKGTEMNQEAIDNTSAETQEGQQPAETSQSTEQTTQDTSVSEQSVEHVEELAKYNSKFVTSAHVAVGELAADIFKQNKNIDQVEAQLGFFGKTDSIEIGVSRTKTYQNHLAERPEDKEITKHLVMKTTVTSQSIKGYGLKSVRESMSEEFQGMFSK